MNTCDPAACTWPVCTCADEAFLEDAPALAAVLPSDVCDDCGGSGLLYFGTDDGYGEAVPCDSCRADRPGLAKCATEPPLSERSLDLVAEFRRGVA